MEIGTLIVEARRKIACEIIDAQHVHNCNENANCLVVFPRLYGGVQDLRA